MNLKNNISLAMNLKAAREKANLTQEYVASQLHISRQAISRWETGKGIPDINNLKELSKLYHISLDELTQNTASPTETELTRDSIPKSYSETLFFIVVIILSLNLPVIGILIPISIIIWTKLTKKKNLFVFWIAIFCIIIEAYNLFVIINHYFFNFGSSYVQPL